MNHPIDAAKRRTANHPCPVCGKHYVNEGSLRKHLACHPETSQLTTSLRMWPCSVCQAVFTHESGPCKLSSRVSLMLAFVAGTLLSAGRRWPASAAKNSPADEEREETRGTARRAKREKMPEKEANSGGKKCSARSPAARG